MKKVGKQPRKHNKGTIPKIIVAIVIACAAASLIFIPIIYMCKNLPKIYSSNVVTGKYMATDTNNADYNYVTYQYSIDGRTYTLTDIKEKDFSSHEDAKLYVSKNDASIAVTEETMTIAALIYALGAVVEWLVVSVIVAATYSSISCTKVYKNESFIKKHHKRHK